MKQNTQAKPRRPGPLAKSAQNGYAIVLVLFFLAMLLISLEMVQRNVIMEGRREKEQELIWRGKQYARGIRLYYQKNLRYPASLEDLSKPTLGVRYMRKAYKDPMNTVDGSWRIISVAPNGMIIGSLRKHDLNLFGTKTNDTGSPLSKPPAGGLPNTFSSPFSAPTNPKSPDSGSAGTQSSPKTGDSSPPDVPSDPNSANLDPSSQNAIASSSGAVPTGDSANQSNAPQSANPVVVPSGGSADTNSSPAIPLIIGVGSKVDRKSVIWLDGEDNYLRFEFIYGLNKRTASTSGVVPDP